MSGFNGRRVASTTEYIRDLNTIPPQETTKEENFTMESDLAMFTNTEFFDIDSGQNTDFQAQPTKPNVKPAASNFEEVHSAAQSVIGDMPNLDFMYGELCSFSLSFLFLFLFLFGIFIVLWSLYISSFHLSSLSFKQDSSPPEHSTHLRCMVTRRQRANHHAHCFCGY